MQQDRLSFPILEELGIESVPYRNNIIITGPPGVGKSIFCENLMCECLNKQVDTIYATLDCSPKDIREKALRHRVETIDSIKSLIFIDGYSWLIGEEKENYHISHLSNLNDFSVKIFNALNEHNDRLHVMIVDSISTLFTYNSEIEITRFIQVNMARIKQSYSICFWAVEENIHTSAFYSSLRHLADGVIEFRLEDGEQLRRFVRIHTFKGLNHKTNWLPFEIQENGEIISSQLL